MKDLYKRVLIIVFALVLLLPIAQMSFNIFELKPLRGAITKVKKKDFTYKDWFSAEYQDNLEKYITDNIGFRKFLIRLFNQVQFNFFNEASANSVVVGKNNVLYEKGYIMAYNGQNFMGSLLISKKCKRIKALQDTLARLNKNLIVCLSPGKGTFYPEYFPTQYEANHTDSSNYKLYKKFFKKEKINYIDVNGWFRSMKDTSKYALYPKYGIHWSYYGGWIFGDSLISYIEKLRNIKMNHFQLYDYEVVEEYRYVDYDIGAGMNLLTELKPEKMCYPKIKWIKDSISVKPKTIVISDSYYWGLYNNGFSINAFRHGEFWYYNREIYSSVAKKRLVKKVNLKEEIEHADVIIIMATEVNYHIMGWGFIERALRLYVDPSHEILNYVDVNGELLRIVKSIKSNKKWYDNIKKKAEKRNRTIDEMVLIDAYWVYQKRIREAIN